jgi:phosphonate transport system substrate-binding protein
VHGVKKSKLGELLLAAGLTLAILRPPMAAAEEALTLGVHPFLPSTELAQKFGPLTDYLSRELDRPVHLEISRDYEVHIESIAEGAYDMAYMGPVSYLHLVGTHGMVPLLAKLEVDGDPSFQGAILVREDSPIRDVGELAGKRFAFVSPSSTMGFIVPHYVMKQAGVSIDSLAGYGFLKNHDNVALAVLIGEFDAGAVKEETFQKFAPKGARALAMTPPIPEHLFVASSRQLPVTVEALRASLLGIVRKPEGLRALRAIKNSGRNLVPVDDRDYDLLRKILSESGQVEITP